MFLEGGINSERGGVNQVRAGGILFLNRILLWEESVYIMWWHYMRWFTHLCPESEIAVDDVGLFSF